MGPMSVSQVAPSPFAALLRRSKFASYDPLIGQVYTTYGGHAHRGNWGLKRPLPTRGRGGFINVRAVDSREQQTEWTSAESSARWIRRWDELGKFMEYSEVGEWSKQSPNGLTWVVDSDFHNIREDEYADSHGDLVRNPESMTPKQFKKYIAHLRTLRPEFKKHIEESWGRQKKSEVSYKPKLQSEVESEALKMTGAGELDMYASAQTGPGPKAIDFLGKRAARELEDSQSTRIRKQPHQFAGLEYTKKTGLQAHYLHKPIPGRGLVQNKSSIYEKGKKESKYTFVAAGGIVGTALHSVMTTDFGNRGEASRQDREQGQYLFQMKTARILDAPKTVGHNPETIKDAKFTGIVFDTPEAVTSGRSNPHSLGSSEYVAAESVMRGKLVPRVIENMAAYANKAATKGRQAYQMHDTTNQEASRVLLKNLNRIIDKAKAEIDGKDPR